MRFPRAGCGVPIGFHRGLFRIPVGLSCYICGIVYHDTVVLLSDNQGIPMAFLQQFHDISLIFLWDYYGMSCGGKLKSGEHEMNMD